MFVRYLLSLKKKILKKNIRNAITVVLLFNILQLYGNQMFDYFNDNYDVRVGRSVGDEKQNESSKRYMMYRCDQALDNDLCGGFGDRLKGILDAYLWSLMVNRTFVIKITRPCNMTNILEPNEVEWSREINVDWWNTGELHKIDKEDFKWSLQSIDFLKLKESKQLLILHTNRNFFDPISKNPLYTNRLVELGFDPDHLDLPYTFRTLYNRLFKLSPHMQRKLDKFLKKARPKPNTKLICAQIRIGGAQHTDRRIRRRNMDVLFQPITNSIRYIDLIRSKFLTNETGKNYKVFLTTDNPTVYDDFLKHFGRKLIHNNGPFNHIDFIEFSKDLNDCSSIEKSVLDFHCLAECDAAVISKSQFGRMGIWRRKDPIKDLYTYNPLTDEFVEIKHLDQLKMR